MLHDHFSEAEGDFEKCSSRLSSGGSQEALDLQGGDQSGADNPATDQVCELITTLWEARRNIHIY